MIKIIRIMMMKIKKIMKDNDKFDDDNNNIRKIK